MADPAASVDWYWVVYEADADSWEPSCCCRSVHFDVDIAWADRVDLRAWRLLEAVAGG